MAKPANPEEYLGALSGEQRDALEQLRQQVSDLVPLAEFTMSYGLPAFKLEGKVVVGFGASRKHCALYAFDGETVDRFASRLEGFDVSKGTIRFAPDHPIPLDVITNIVQSKVASIRGETS